MKYTIVELRCNHYDVDEFCAEVQMMIDDGWKPIGGVSVSPTTTDQWGTWSQALIKE